MQSSLSPNLDQETINKAVEHLRKGELVAFPTETVYGLGADASNDKALKKLYATKRRPDKHPVIVHLASFEQITDWCTDLPEYARILAENFWPGPITLVGKKAKHVSSLITGGQDTIGIRVPAHPIALALLKAFSGGIAAPSANKYGRISATCAEHVRQEFGKEVSIIIDGGNCPVGIESTIVDVTGAKPKILRPGIISEIELLDRISAIAGASNSSFGSSISSSSSSSSSSGFSPSSSLYDTGMRIRVPGSDKSHYAPQTPLLLMNNSSLVSFLNQKNSTARTEHNLSYALLTFDKPENFNSINVKEYIQAPTDACLYARELYANLRKLDRSGANYIVVEAPPDSLEWTAILDRLRRAATKF